MKTIIEEFFERRFGKNHPRDSYYAEWVRRFATGCPEGFMDIESLRIYAQLLKEKSESIKTSLSIYEPVAMIMRED